MRLTQLVGEAAGCIGEIEGQLVNFSLAHSQRWPVFSVAHRSRLLESSLSRFNHCGHGKWTKSREKPAELSLPQEIRCVQNVKGLQVSTGLHQGARSELFRQPQDHDRERFLSHDKDNH